MSNLPAKAGAPVLASFFSRLSGASGSAPLLVPGGRAAVVVVKPLTEATSSWIAEAGLSVVGRSRGSGHEVFIVERGAGRLESDPAESGPELGAYLRGEARFKLASLSYRAKGFWGLPEFDTPGYGSSATAEVLSRVFAAAPKSAGAGSKVPSRTSAAALVIEPGAGHAAIWIARELGPRRLVAASRDALSLAATRMNLAALPERARPGYAAVDALGLLGLSAASFDLIVEFPEIVPELDWTASSWERAGRLLGPGGVYLACCSPTESLRLEKRRPSGAGSCWTLLCRRRKKGFVALAWRRN